MIVKLELQVSMFTVGCGSCNKLTGHFSFFDCLHNTAEGHEKNSLVL